MTVLSAQTIRRRVGLPPSPAFRLQIEPFHAEKELFDGMSYGLTAAGYDIRIGAIDREEYYNPHTGERGGTAGPRSATLYSLEPGEFVLCSSLEWMRIPHDIQAIVHDKSTLARQGVALQNTVLEPGWFGHITLELSNHGPNTVVIRVGQPIAQVVFHRLDEPTDRPYKGKYQDQPNRPVAAIKEGS